MADRNLNDDKLKLVRYSIVSIERDRERALPGACNRCEVFADDMTAGDFESWVVARYAQRHEIPYRETKSLRVVYEVLDRWPRKGLGFESKQLRRLKGIELAIRACCQAKPSGPGAAARIEAREEASADDAAPGAKGSAEESPPAELDEVESDILAGLEALGGQAAIGELAKECGLSRSTLRQKLPRLIDEEAVRRVGEGLKTRYQIVE